MNLGIYVKNLSDEKEITFASNLVNYALSKNITDCSIFYDGVGFIPYDIPCGMFNSTDLWNFDGTLLVLNIDCLKSTFNIINDIDVYYHYGWEDKISVFNLLYVCNQNIKIISKTDNDDKTLYRLTGKQSVLISEDQNVIDYLLSVEK